MKVIHCKIIFAAFLYIFILSPNQKINCSKPNSHTSSIVEVRTRCILAELKDFWHMTIENEDDYDDERIKQIKGQAQFKIITYIEYLSPDVRKAIYHHAIDLILEAATQPFNDMNNSEKRLAVNAFRVIWHENLELPI